MKEIALPRGLVAVVDDEDFDLLNSFTWHFTLGYAVRHLERPGSGVYRTTERMHRMIMGVGPGTIDKRQVDHINGNKLDNRKSNLRVCTNAENGRNRGAQKNNSSGYKGVCWHPQSGKWRARIKVDGRQISLGLHASAEAAHKAYEVGARKFHGEFANVGAQE
ncbi:HNH endonuclease [Burkholderia pseudomallei]|uniref:HNH endonuclease n=1 Tax=Burkholderia pseudomallei TaxID=28450 RepID=UPI000A1A0FAF|nr:HNH endonuclease [Burkholderia pseudomallei]ARL91005.1 hypothetical protein BOC57_35100 [Burkholderia pseudomallei]